MSFDHLFTPFELGPLPLENRIVMAPMTRCRAIENVPNELMAKYYEQRSGAGLIITEGTAPSPNGLGYARIPGMWSDAQIEGWIEVTEKVHDAGGKIYLQLMHCGRMSHPDNMPSGAEMVAPSAVAADDTMYTDTDGEQKMPKPRAMNEEDIEEALSEYETAAVNAVKAGFDGVELHGANGYLIEQFLHPDSNERDDNWGGTPFNRNRFAFQAARRVIDAIGNHRVGMRLSPFGAFGDLAPYDGEHDQYETLAKGLAEIGLTYIHLVDHSSMGTPDVPDETKDAIAEAFGGTIIFSGGYDAERAEEDLAAERCHLVAFGRPFIANPDLPHRMKEGIELAEPDPDTFYTPDEKGYTDYPTAD